MRISSSFKITLKGQHAYEQKQKHKLTRQIALLKINSVPFGAINPGHRYIFQDDNDCERKTSRVVIEHGDEIISRPLDE